MADPMFKLDGRWVKQAKGRYEKYNFEVGVLKDGPHKSAPSKSRRSKSAGRPKSNISLGDLSKLMRKKLGVNFYLAPFAKKSSDVRAFVKAFFNFTSGRGSKLAVETALQAVVRNPILRGAYGHNKAATAKAKGSNTLLINTGQLFKAIVAKVTARNV